MNDYSGIKECVTDSKEVREMIINNPDLPLIFLCGEESYCDDYGYTVNIGTAKIEELSLYKDMLIEREDLVERLNDDLSDGNKDLSDEDYEKLVYSEIEKYEFTKAITVRLG